MAKVTNVFVVIVIFSLAFRSLSWAQGSFSDRRKQVEVSNMSGHVHHGGDSSGSLMEAHRHPYGQSPIGVIGDHAHEKGKWMLSYKYMFMNMRGNRDGTDSLSTSEVLKEFMVAPTDMDMHMHMLGIMYAPTQTLTLMAMVPYLQLSMDHVARTGVKFRTRSEGIGDIRLSGIRTVYMKGSHHAHLILGASLPTGSINEKDDTPAGKDQRLPYPMQLGSGTFDASPGVIYLGQKGDWFWGGRALAVFRIGRNSNGYSFGDKGSLTAWGARRWIDWLSTSVRLDGQIWGDIKGRDKKLNPTMVPTANPDLRDGKRLDLLFGINVYIEKGILRGHLFAVESGFPLYQSLDGPQLESDWQMNFGWQWTF